MLYLEILNFIKKINTLELKIIILRTDTVN